MNQFEHIEQSAFITWCDDPDTIDRYPNVNMIFANANGGKRPIGVARKMKAEGVKAGVPDLFLPVSRNGYHGLFIEMKVKGGSARKNQNEWIDYLNSVGYKAVVCYGRVEAMQAIDRYYYPPCINSKLHENETEQK